MTDIYIGARVPQEIAEKLDRLAAQTRRTRSETLRLLIENAEPADLVPAEMRCADGATVPEEAAQ